MRKLKVIVIGILVGYGAAWTVPWADAGQGRGKYQWDKVRRWCADSKGKPGLNTDDRTVAPCSNLRKADLSGANLPNAKLMGSNLSRSKLRKAKLRNAQLVGANLSSAELEGADLSGANLEGADLGGAQLKGSILSRARMKGANLNSANLEGADLSRAIRTGAALNSANLAGANLSGAKLKGASLVGAAYDRSTKLPRGINPEDAGMVVWVPPVTPVAEEPAPDSLGPETTQEGGTVAAEGGQREAASSEGAVVAPSDPQEQKKGKAKGKVKGKKKGKK